MHLRKLDIAVGAVATAAGMTLPPETMAGESGRMLVTFLGLFSASVFPTVSLLINSMASNGRSVLAINALRDELVGAMDALFLVFGCVALAVGALVALAIDMPAAFANRALLAELLPRFGQAIVVTATSLIILRGIQVPAILRRALSVRHQIAVEEAKRVTREQAPESAAIQAMFPTHPEHGKIVTLEQARAGKAE